MSLVRPLLLTKRMESFASRIAPCVGISIMMAALSCCTMSEERATGPDAALEDRRGWLGARFELQPTSYLEHDHEGTRITSVLPGLAAERGGLRKGDLVLGVDSELIRTRSELQAVLTRYSPGERLKISVCRLGRHEALAVRLDRGEDVADLVLP